MLLLLSLIHAIAANHPASGHALDAREEPSSCNDINNCRTLFSIISGCLATIFACTWVSVHPNVPPPNQSKLALTWRRFCLMLVAVIAPELMAGFAARQFLDARWFSKKYGVSRTHGFFFVMGGFATRNGHHPIVTQKQLESFPEYLMAIKCIREEDIDDKSKGDAMSKGVVFLQGLWFTAQSLARVHQHLPLTELEVATIAFQFVNIFIWLLWWHKPLDIQHPILIGPGDESIADGAPREPLLTVLVGLVSSVVMGISLAFEPDISTSVPSFWSPLRHLETHLLSIITTGKLDADLPSITIEALVGTIFGVIHCAAWNARFPSATEMWMWRSCSLTVAAIPILLGVAFISMVILCSSQNSWKVCPIILRTVFWVTIPIYTGARLFLIVLPFTTLRGLPPGAFVDVNWSMYIPHVGL
ncbi:hypothetical protein B0H19DRAFT_1015087 [Mycena capillaripes]|nr:hypothetical protein B0H19DRAFT_1015087 [Mycena capillaripes]